MERKAKIIHLKIMDDYTAIKKQKHIEGLKAKKEMYLHMKRYDMVIKIQDRIDKLTTK